MKMQHMVFKSLTFASKQKLQHHKVDYGSENHSVFFITTTSYISKNNPPSSTCHPATSAPNLPPPPLNSIQPPTTTFQRRCIQMEVEVKLRLPDSNAHQRLSSILSPFHLKTHIQENIFFDGPNSELATNLAALRLRFYDLDSQCVLSLKAKPVMTDGISRIEEEEEPLDPAIGRACVAEPWRLLLMADYPSKIMKRVRDEYGVNGDDEKCLVCLGGFRNVRAVYEWNGLKLELDETSYDFGTCYEIECETSEPELAKNLLEELLKSNGIEFSYSKSNKFAIFLSGKLPL